MTSDEYVMVDTRDVLVGTTEIESVCEWTESCVDTESQRFRLRQVRNFILDCHAFEWSDELMPEYCPFCGKHIEKN